MEIDNVVQWAILPDLVLEKIFSFLSATDRFRASLVCRHWSHSFNLPAIWHKITIDDKWLRGSMRKNGINLPPAFDYERAKLLLTRIGHHIKHIDIHPSVEFACLYQFLILMDWFAASDAKYRKIQKLTFKLECDQKVCIDPNGIKLFGIGGQLIFALRQFLSNLIELKELTLTDLVLERFEANKLMDKVSISLWKSVRKLSLVNLTQCYCPITQIAMFSQLEVLVVSPQNIDNSMLAKLSEINLKHLYIVQNRNTLKAVLPCQAFAWLAFRSSRINKTQVHLIVDVSSVCDCDLVIQPMAPTVSVTCSMKNIMAVIGNYKETLSIFWNKNPLNTTNLPLFYRKNDEALIEMCISCRTLTKMVISEAVSTGALLLMIKLGSRLKSLLVRKAIVVIDCDDWIKNICVEHNFDPKWLARSAASIDLVEREMSKHFSNEWHFSSEDFLNKKIERIESLL